MNKQITNEELNEIRNLLNTHNNMIFRFEQYSKQLKEPQLKSEFQKLYASAINHKKKLLSVLGSQSNSQ